MDAPTLLTLRVPAFEAAIRKAVDPALAGRPVAVVTSFKPLGRVLAACPSALAAGIAEEMHYPEARNLCPDAAFFTPDRRLAERALAAFKAGEIRALVATDIAARGIDIDAVSHVVQYELPNVPEAYVHRIGRTARAGADGSAIAFCADDERNLLRDIQKVTRQTIPSFDRRNDKGLALMTKAIAEVSPEPAAREPRGSPKARDPRSDVPAALRKTRGRRKDGGRGGQGAKPGGGAPKGGQAGGVKASGERFRGPRRDGAPATRSWSPLD